MNSVFASRNIPVRATKAMLAPFDGSNPLEWIFQAESYFELNQVAIPQHLALVPFFMTGLALAWFTWLHATHQLTQAVQISPVPWNFDLAIILRQSPVLFKLLQTTTVTEYQMQFEALSNRVEGMNLDLLLNFFLYLVYVWT